MIKGLIFSLLFLFSSVAFAYDYAFMMKPIGNDLVLSIDGKRVATISEYKLKSKERQKKILDSALKGLDFCTSKGKWGHSLADEAKHKINNVEHHIDYLKEMVKGANVPRHMIVDNERMIREAYRSGHKDPYAFGKRMILECLQNGF